MKYCKLPGLPDDLNCNQWLKDKNVPSIRFCKDHNARKNPVDFDIEQNVRYTASMKIQYRFTETSTKAF